MSTTHTACVCVSVRVWISRNFREQNTPVRPSGLLSFHVMHIRRSAKPRV